MEKKIIGEDVNALVLKKKSNFRRRRELRKMAQVEVEVKDNESIDSAIRRFKQKCRKAGIFDDRYENDRRPRRISRKARKRRK